MPPNRDTTKSSGTTEGPKGQLHAEGVGEADGAEKRAADQNAAMIHGPRGDEGPAAEAAKEPKTGKPGPVKGATKMAAREEPTDKQVKAREQAAIDNASKFQPVLNPAVPTSER